MTDPPPTGGSPDGTGGHLADYERSFRTCLVELLVADQELTDRWFKRPGLASLVDRFVAFVRRQEFGVSVGGLNDGADEEFWDESSTGDDRLWTVTLDYLDEYDRAFASAADDRTRLAVEQDSREIAAEYGLPPRASTAILDAMLQAFLDQAEPNWVDQVPDPEPLLTSEPIYNEPLKYTATFEVLEIELPEDLEKRISEWTKALERQLRRELLPAPRRGRPSRKAEGYAELVYLRAFCGQPFLEIAQDRCGAFCELEHDCESVARVEYRRALAHFS